MRKILAQYRSISSQISNAAQTAQGLVRRAREVAGDTSLSADDRRAAVMDLRQDLETQKILKAQLARECRALETLILQLVNNKIHRAALARCGHVRAVPGRRPTVRARRSQTAQAEAHGADSGGSGDPDPEPPRRPHAYICSLPACSLPASRVGGV